MKKLIVLLSALFALQIASFSQTDKDLRDYRLHDLYDSLKVSPYVKGIPDSYEKFITVFEDPERLRLFYNSLYANVNLRKHVVAPYKNFLSYFRLSDKWVPVQTIPSDNPYKSISDRQQELTRLRALYDLFYTTNEFINPDRTENYDNTDGYNAGRYYIAPTIPGSGITDYSRSGYGVDGNSVYQTLPGTTIKDYSKPGYKIDGDNVYPTLPGTNVRDYSQPGYSIIRRD